MTFTVVVDTDDDESLYSQLAHVGTALRRVAADVGYAGIYDTAYRRLITEPILDSHGHVLATVSIETPQSV